MSTCRDFTEATLWVLAANRAARAFYERLGWAADGHTKTDVRDGVETLQVRYRRPLPAVPG